jgi:phage baseplate assembly protein W
MPDLSLEFGTDLQIGPTGDLACADATVLGLQRVLRRMLTNPGDYIWQPNYGAGLAQFVGATLSTDRISAVVRSQVFKEPAVATTPEPIIECTSIGSDQAVLTIGYVDANTGATQVLSLPVGGP